ncbi:acetyl-CoA hydrolase/transferase C-terminal domain-containing protein [Wenxinia marina]|uniref:acetyl-CoA hydrolase/transferase C-terminal domain-containing protein n=1 Tax=Wenxinia marina TaxID=390641 RepID=UPI0003AAC269|nr:acetyl-CoA hydrolase/transferase C-terminal domain-containing protein [Wenxinia marina]GGL60977.1 hypothetical protein GCM10011392_14340 [Wenxinia marina]
MAPVTSRDPRALVREIAARVGPDIRVALPLGLGKPVTLLNALIDVVREDRSLNLSIFTALTLERPAASSDLERRFLEPAADRLFGRYPEIAYARMLRDGTLPPNIEVREFFLMAGRWMSNETVQQSYTPAAYVHAFDRLVERRPNVLLQLVPRLGDDFSLSCNTDISADLFRLRRDGALDFLAACETNAALPAFGGAARLPAEDVDLLLTGHEEFELFSAPRQPVSEAQHAIGLHVARTIPDGGTLQVGIGALGDAVANALLLRGDGRFPAIAEADPFSAAFAEAGRFETGLYCTTEMFVAGLLALVQAGVIRRQEMGAVLHAGFFVESRDFYGRLKAMEPDLHGRLEMVPVSFTNALYGDEAAKRAARQGARFVNAAMKATLLGAVCSDATEGETTVSGVGGQMDFVLQAFALQGARSVLTLPATRKSHGRTESNIVWSYGHTTIPHFLRDLIVTEYGIADLRGKTDAQAAAAMVCIADARYQDDLTEAAKKAGKLPRDWQVPPARRNNTPEAVTHWLDRFRDDVPAFPLGTDFTEIEQRLLPALARLKSASGRRLGIPSLIARTLGRPAVEGEDAALARLDLAQPKGLKDRLTARAVRAALRA